MAELRNAERRSLAIDALRGIAALWVVSFHATSPIPFEGVARTTRWLTPIGAYLSAYGFLGVYLFFVISGFCIHMRWAKRASGHETAVLDFRSFWVRRLRRLYPPYLLAAVLYLAVEAYWGTLPTQAPLSYDVVLHALMLHNFDIRTCHSISGVFWTLAIEEQLYLMYFLLVPMRSRFGWARTLAVCFAARVAWFGLAALLHRRFQLTIPVTQAAASHWFVWALGAVAVEHWYGMVRLPAWCRKLWVSLAVLLAAAAITYVDWFADQGTLRHKILWMVNFPLWGVGFFVLVNHLVEAERTWKQGRAPGALRILAGVGLFSYSLYLTHELILVQVVGHLRDAVRVPEQTLVPLTLYGLVPSSIAFAWLFFRLAERPFLNARKAPAQVPGLPEAAA